MLSHDELAAMPDDEREAYRQSEVERVISSADPKKQLALRAMQARYMARMRKIKNRYIRAEMAFFLMRDSFIKLKQTIDGGDTK